MKSKIKIRTDVLQKWQEVNPVLLNGEIAYVSDTKSWRIGNGAWRFSELQNFPLVPNITPADIGAATTAQGAKADSALQASPELREAIVPGEAFQGLWFDQAKTLLPDASATTYLASYGSLTSGGWQSVITKNLDGSWTWTHQEKSGPTFPIRTRTDTSSIAVFPYTAIWPSAGIVAGSLISGSALSIASGGTGATTAEQARVNLGISSDNNRITLGTPNVAEGRLVLRSGTLGEKDVNIFNDEGTLVLDDKVNISLQNTAVYGINITTEQLTASQTYTLPNASGILALDGHVHPLPTPAAIGAAPLVHGHFQPNPDFPTDAEANALIQGWGVAVKESQHFGTIYNLGGFFTNSGGRALVYDGAGFVGAAAGKWAFISDDGEGNYELIASATQNGGAYPWSVSWNNNLVTKNPTSRLVGAPLAAIATEGTSAYAARADHVHPLPSSSQVWPILLQGGKIPSGYLPSYVDDVSEYGTLAELQADTAARENGKIYVVRNTGKIYRWSGGTLFVEISNTLELGDLQLPDSYAGVDLYINSAPSARLSKNGTYNGKTYYSLTDNNDGWQLLYDVTRWKAEWTYLGDGSESSVQSNRVAFAAVGNERYPWQATWTNATVARAGEYSAALAPTSLGPDASSGVGTKAAREDHVHPLPTPADIGAEPAITALPIAKGGTGATDAATARVNLGVSAGAAADIQIFATKGSSNWIKPAGAKSVNIQLFGAGGGGGSGAISNSANVRTGGGGGGGGSYVNITVPASALGSSESVTIGAGGPGGQAATPSTHGDGNSGERGGDTIFGTAKYFTAIGGNKGWLGINGATAGAGGAAILQSNAGAPSSASGGLGFTGSPIGNTAAAEFGGVGGGSGGGLTAGGAFSGGGVGGFAYVINKAGGARGVAAGGSGEAGIANGSTNFPAVGSGGGGGASAGVSQGSGGNGGEGGFPASGGGGGGAAADGAQSGAGGKGANGLAIITTYF